MKKIKELSNTTWKNHEIEDLSTLSGIRGGVGNTKTKDATYFAARGGGHFDDGSEDKQHESMASISG